MKREKITATCILNIDWHNIRRVWLYHRHKHVTYEHLSIGGCWNILLTTGHICNGSFIRHLRVHWIIQMTSVEEFHLILIFSGNYLNMDEQKSCSKDPLSSTSKTFKMEVVKFDRVTNLILATLILCLCSKYKYMIQNIPVSKILNCIGFPYKQIMYSFIYVVSEFS